MATRFFRWLLGSGDKNHYHHWHFVSKESEAKFPCGEPHLATLIQQCCECKKEVA